MLSKPLAEIAEADLLALVEGGALESRTLEFKLKPWPKLADPTTEKHSKAELAKDVTAFANSIGGDIVIGMRSGEGAATALEGFESADIDEDVRRLSQVIEAQTDPALFGTDMRAIGLSNGRHALIIRIPRSWIGPHRVRLDREFYVRNSMGVNAMDTWQLRTAFLATTVEKEMRQFRMERLALIEQASATTPYPTALERGVRIVLHFLPWESFAEPRRLNLDDLRRQMGHFWRDGAHDRFPNLDGYIAQWNRGGSEGYTQFFRNGAVETVDVVNLGAGGGDSPINIAPGWCERRCRTAIRDCVAFMRAASITPPMAIALALTNARGAQCREPESGIVLPVDRVIAPGVMMTGFEQDPSALARTILEPLWNAFGISIADL